MYENRIIGLKEHLTEEAQHIKDCRGTGEERNYQTRTGI